MERAILEERARPDSAEIAAAAESAESAFEASWSEVTAQIGDVDPLAGGRPGGLRVAAVGRPAVAGERSIRVPVTLRDEHGRELALSLTVRIDPAGEGGP